MATTPNIDLPIRFEGNDLVCNEQDSIADYENKAEVLMRYRPGDRTPMPEFGSPGLLGRIAPMDLSELQRAFQQWIPEANYRIAESADPSSDVDRGVSIQVDTPSTTE